MEVNLSLQMECENPWFVKLYNSGIVRFVLKTQDSTKIKRFGLPFVPTYRRGTVAATWRRGRETCTPAATARSLRRQRRRLGPARLQTTSTNVQRTVRARRGGDRRDQAYCPSWREFTPNDRVEPRFTVTTLLPPPRYFNFSRPVGQTPVSFSS